MTTNPYPVPKRDHTLTIVAWVVVILISTLPDILWAELGGGDPSPLAWVKIGLLLVLALVSLFWPRLRPLRNFFVALLAFFLLFQFFARLNFEIPALQRLLGNSVFDERMQAEQTGKLIVTLGMIAVLLLLGLRRRDFFLARGDVRAPIEPVRFLGFPKPEPWPSFGLQWGFYIAAALAVVQYLILRPSLSSLGSLVPILPSILFYAALNAFNEEMTYRAPLIATLEPVGGSRQALWLSAYFFGIAHYFGIPGGLLGGLLSIFMGWILGKAMVETRGLFWSWWIHFLSDVVIFTFLTLGLLG